MSDRDRMRERYARSEARNEEIRQNLEPLEPGERPRAVTIAVIAALVLAIANVIATLIGGDDVADSAKGQTNATVSGFVLSGVLVVCAVFMWRAKYWAVLGYQALLAIQIIICFAAITRASSWLAVVVLLILMCLGGWLFWSLVRAMARIQMPER
jgi:hypothetical protein